MSECEFSKMLSRFHDSELLPEQGRIVETHLRDCAVCSAELEQLQIMSQSLRAQAVANPKASSQFLARLDALADGVEDRVIYRFVMRLTAAAAAVLLAATVHWTLLRMHAPAPMQTVGTPIALAPDERMVIDPDSNVPTPGSDVTLASDASSDSLVPGLSGDRQ